MKRKRLARPHGLSKASAALWDRLVAEYQIRDSAGLAILEAGLRSHDRAEEARRLLDREGCTIKDRFGQRRPHPATVVERDSRASFLGALKQLHMDIPSGGEETI